MGSRFFYLGGGLGVFGGKTAIKKPKSIRSSYPPVNFFFGRSTENPHVFKKKTVRE